MRPARLARSAAVVTALISLLAPAAVLARPNYFATFTSLYGLSEGQDLYNCGVCHRRWEGTGARNPYGTAIEQELYIGKVITDAILDVEDDDTDGDGFTNVDEITLHGTLPGYSCANYTLVINPPPNFQSLITPGVPSCLEPKDVLITPTALAFVTEVNKVDTLPVTVVNNGTDDPITVSAYSLLPGAHAALSAVSQSLPIVIPVGQTATIEVTFSPTATGLATGTLRITSDDPDETDIDIPVSGIAFVKNLAPTTARAACFKEAERRLEGLNKKHLKEWAKCYLDELQGVACDSGRRDLKIARAESKLRDAIGGERDRKCAGEGLTPTLLDLPDQCGAPCGAIEIDTIADWADCMICRQEAATVSMLDAAVGTVPPDLPLNLLAPDPLSCNRKVVRRVQTSARNIQRMLGACRLSNVTAVTPTDCPATFAAQIMTERFRADDEFNFCTDTNGMLGCRFGMGANVYCLGNTSEAIGVDLVETVFETKD